MIIIVITFTIIGPPTSDLDASRNVENCRELLRNVEKCREMLSFVEVGSGGGTLVGSFCRKPHVPKISVPK